MLEGKCTTSCRDFVKKAGNAAHILEFVRYIKRGFFFELPRVWSSQGEVEYSRPAQLMRVEPLHLYCRALYSTQSHPLPENVPRFYILSQTALLYLRPQSESPSSTQHHLHHVSFIPRHEAFCLSTRQNSQAHCR